MDTTDTINPGSPDLYGAPIFLTYGNGEVCTGTVEAVEDFTVVADFGGPGPGRIPISPEGLLPKHVRVAAH
jgi:ribosomal protein S1